MGYIKKGLFLFAAILCVMPYGDLFMGIEKPALQDLKTEEAFDPLKIETLHPDSAINRKTYA